VLKNITLRFEPRTVTALVGTSGSGKSTLLRMLIGLDVPDQGRVLVDENALLPGQHLALRRTVGYVTQDGGLFPHLTVRDNLALLPGYLHWRQIDIDARIAELAVRMQLPAVLLQRFPAELSGGQRQRAAVIRALMIQPVALLLDEPLGALDPVIRFDLQEQLQQEFAQLGGTVILVTHDLEEAAFLASRIVLLHEGEIVQDGTPDRLFEHPANAFVEKFVHARRSLSARLPA
jgi:osmoprotectant transport system ATP-binding protein